MAEQPQPTNLEWTEPTSYPAKILLVDDNPANLRSLRVLLEDLGQVLVEARSGDEALGKLQSEEFAVVLLEVFLPGLSGFETARLIRKNDKVGYTPIIFVTANHVDRQQLEEAYLLGAVDFLIKPILPVILQAKVRGFVELYKSNQKARREADQLRLLVQGTSDYAIYMLNPSGVIVTWNTGAERLKGYTAEEIIGQHFSRFYTSEALENGWPIHELLVARSEGRFEDEGWRVRKDGSRFWANVVITPLRDEKQKLRGFSKVTRDLTARKRADEALHRSEERFRLLVENARDYAIFLLSCDGIIETWNTGAQRIKQYQADEIIGQHFSRFYPQEAIDRRWPEFELNEAREKGRFEDEGWRVRRDGTQFWANVVITALFDETGQLRGFSKITRDMTERKRGEENARRLIEEETARRFAEENARAILEQREELHVTLASIGDAVISTDASGRVKFMNPVAQKLVGWTNEEAMGMNLSEVFPIFNEDTRRPVANPALRALEEGVIVGLANHTILVSKDGSEYPIDDSAAPIRNAEGNVIGCVLVFRDISDRKASQEALGKSEGRFRGLMEQAPFSMQIFSPDGQTVQVNRAWEQLWGLNLEQISDYNILQDTQLESKGVLPFIRKAFAGEAVKIPAICYDPNETIPGRTTHREPQRWVAAVAYPLKQDDGDVREVILVHEDITEQRQTDVALLESEKRLRLALEAGKMGVWDWDIRTNKINWSDTLEPLHGLAPGTFDGTFEGFQQLIHPGDRQRVAEAIQNAVEQGTGYDLEFRNVWPNGSIHWITGKGMVIRGSGGQAERMIGIGMDVTMRHRSEQTARFLASASATLAVLLDYESTLQKIASLAVPYFADWATVDLLEPDGSLKRVAVTHVDSSKVALAHDVHRRFPPDPNDPQGVWRIIRTGQSELVPVITDDMLVRSIQDEELLQIIRALGLKSYIGVPLKVRGVTLGVVTFISAESNYHYDVTDLTMAQDLAERGAIAIENTRLYRELQDADRRKDEFLATLAHELRNPLAPIRNSLQILKTPGVDAQIAGQTREMIERQVHHLVRLVDDLLDVSRVMRGKIELRKEPVEVATIVARAVETAKVLFEIQGHQLDVFLPSEPLILNADPVRLTQVVGNLLTNAAKYTESEGRIVLTGRREGDFAVLSIQDNGIGIAPEMLPQIFDLFVQVDHTSTKAQGGLGIGLTLVKNLVEMHHGSVYASSPGLGKGSEFLVRLPLLIDVTGRIAAMVDTDVESVQPSVGNRVLIVDDNKDAAISLSLLLKLKGYEVQVAHDGLNALELAADFQPELIFLDIGMPGMDGYEVARRIRKIPGLEKTVLTALTGWGQQEDRRRTAAAGFDHHLVKPPELKLVEALLASLPKHDATPGN